jgi:hypothetical protein
MKKNIKLLFSILTLSAMIMMLGGCKKFLDRKPLTATLDDLNQGGLEGQIYGLYSNLRGSAGFTTIPWLAMHDFRSDDSEKGSDPSDGAEWVAPFDKYAYVKDLWASNTYWDDHYSLINLANTAIQTADSLKLTDAASIINIAEARFLRAYAYFDLARSFGDVPKIDFRVYNASQANIAKSPVSAIYALIDADLQYAALNLPVVWGNQFPGRLTSGAAKTLNAKAHLFRGNWAQAQALCQQVIATAPAAGYSLYSSYYGIFKDAGENSSESIFEIQAYVSPNGSIDNGCGFATTQGVRASTASGWNLGWGWNTPTDNLVTAYEAGDVRKGSTILFSGQSDDPSTGGYGRVLPNSTFDVVPGPLPRKYWNKKIYADPAYRISTGHSDNPNWINKRILRYADVILMAAECYNETGAGAASALPLVNQIRSRAGLAAIAFTSQTQLRTAIKQERRVEFGVEGERFFDLVRWGDAVSVLGPLGYTNRCRFYPIPQPSIDKSNGVLIQNIEW